MPFATTSTVFDEWAYRPEQLLAVRMAGQCQCRSATAIVRRINQMPVQRGSADGIRGSMPCAAWRCAMGRDAAHHAIAGVQPTLSTQGHGHDPPTQPLAAHIWRPSRYTPFFARLYTSLPAPWFRWQDTNHSDPKTTELGAAPPVDEHQNYPRMPLRSDGVPCRYKAGGLARHHASFS